MRRVVICCIVCSMLPAIIRTVYAQSPYQVKKSTQSDVEFSLSNYGIFALDIAASKTGFFVPRGSGLSYIFGAGLWFGAMKRVGGDTSKLAFITYNANSGTSWAAPEGVDVPAKAEPLYHSVDYDHITGKTLNAGFGPTWPLWIFNGQEPRPGDPGHYESIWSERVKAGARNGPAFMPGVAEQFVARFNDRSLEKYEKITVDSARAIGYPLGLDIIQNVYAWNAGPFRDVVVIEYEIMNRSIDTLFECTLAQMTDPDVGDGNNDRASFYMSRPELRAAYVWTDPEAKAYKVLVTAVIEGPVTDEEGFIDRSTLDVRKRYRLEGRLGACQNWPIEEDPLTPTQRYDFMSDRTQFDDDLGPGDRRLLLSTTRFNMRPFDTARFTVMYGVISARPSENPGSKPTELETLLEAIDDAYYNHESFVADVTPEYSQLEAETALLTPNPTHGHARLRFTSDVPGSGILRVANSLGEEVLLQKVERLDGGVNEVTIDLKGLPAGLYLVSVSAGLRTSTAKLMVVR